MASLDVLCATYLRERTEASRSHLLAAVLGHAKRHTRDEDAASDVALVVIRKLPDFAMSRPDGFSRFVSAVCSRTMKAHRRRAAKARATTLPFDECAHSGGDEPAFRFDLSALPDDIAALARLLFDGRSIAEAGAALGIKPQSARQKLRRFRHASQFSRHL